MEIEHFKWDNQTWPELPDKIVNQLQEIYEVLKAKIKVHVNE